MILPNLRSQIPVFRVADFTTHSNAGLDKERDDPSSGRLELAKKTFDRFAGENPYLLKNYGLTSQ